MLLLLFAFLAVSFSLAFLWTRVNAQYTLNWLDTSQISRVIHSSHAIKVGDTLYVSGMLGDDPATGDLAQGGIEIETRRVLTNIGILLNAAHLKFKDIVKTTVFLTSIDDLDGCNDVYVEFFAMGPPPAMSIFQVVQLPKRGFS